MLIFSSEREDDEGSGGTTSHLSVGKINLLSTYLGLGDAPWMEAAEHLRRVWQVQLERDLACKATVQSVWEEMEQAEEWRAHKQEG